MKLIMENWKKYLNESGEMPPRGHMPYPAGYTWGEETKTFYGNVERLYSDYKDGNITLPVFGSGLKKLWGALKEKPHGLQVFNQLVDDAEQQGDAEFDDFDNAMLDAIEDWY